ncbi:MAG: cation:proton antiporter [Nitriliruptorales bacterium]|nr:cation:proton antiporter [Nitriliruptorales bacterium]
MDTATLLVELGGVLLVLAVAARAALKLGLSPIPLYLLIGLALGQGGLYPLVTAEGFILPAAEIGVVLLLLLLGLEYTPQELASGLRTGWRLSLLDLLANFTPGLVAGLLLGWGAIASIVLGGVTYVSSSGIAAKLIDDQGWFANRETPLVLSLLVAEDLVMAVYLPLVGALLAGGGVLAVGGSVAVALAVAGTTLAVAMRYGETISASLFSPSGEVLLLSILGLALLIAGLAERLHISAGVGAFLVGIALSGPVQERAHGLLQPLRDLFAASFFVLFGLSVDPRNIPPVLLIAAVLAAVTAVTKVAAVWWGARRAGLGPRARWRAGSVLVARGEFSIVIAEIGVAAGIEHRLGALATAYVLLLAVAGPVMARLAARTAR